MIARGPKLPWGPRRSGTKLSGRWLHKQLDTEKSAPKLQMYSDIPGPQESNASQAQARNNSHRCRAVVETKHLIYLQQLQILNSLPDAL